MANLKDLECPYINKKKAALHGTNYYCEFDGMEFDSMQSHCWTCEMYECLMKRAEKAIFGDVCNG